jgi:hypothetical protein
MGWDGVKLGRGETPEAYARKMMGGDKNVVDMVTMNGTIYAAVTADMDSEVDLYRKGDVLGLVVLVEYRDGYTMFKFLDEFSGPCAADAPAKIIRQLSPIRDGEKCQTMRDYARNWRQRCIVNVKNKQ